MFSTQLVVHQSGMTRKGFLHSWRNIRTGGIVLSSKMKPKSAGIKSTKEGKQCQWTDVTRC